MNQIIQSAKTLMLIFASTVIGMVVAGGADVLSLHSWGDFRPYAAAGVAAVVAYAYNFLSPYDTRYGVGSGEDL